MTTHSAIDAYDMVLQYAGACNYRDKLDELIISDVRKGVATCTGSAKEWESLKGWSDNKPGYINKPSDIGTNAGQLDEKDSRFWQQILKYALKILTVTEFRIIGKRNMGLILRKMMRMNGLLMLMVNILISRCI